MRVDLGRLSARYHRAFNDRDFDVWREVFDEDVELVVDGISFHGVDAAVAYGVGSVSQFPGLYIASERIVAESEDAIVTEINLVNGDPAKGNSRHQGTACEISRVRDGRIVSCRSYYMAEPAGRPDAVRVPARAEAAVVAEEQAALRHVATLVAHGVSQDELFAAVSQEIGWLVGADATSLMRFEADDTVTLVAAWSTQQAGVPNGSSRPMDEGLRSLRETGRGQRWGPAEFPPTGPFLEEGRALGIRASVGVPIVVDERMWGVALASSTADHPFADDAEARIAGFTELVATAISNAESRGSLRRLLNEQAALRRVATLVAQGVPSAEIFSAVSDEVARLFGAGAAVLKFEHDDEAVALVGVSKGVDISIGARWKFQPGMASGEVYRTGRPARVDPMDWSSARGPVATTARRLGTLSTVVSPIVVDGRLWGGMSVSSTEERLPFDTEGRLEEFTELIGTAIANAESHAALDASRRRIVTASDETRRRIERDLHDGTQQRLVSLGLAVRAAEANVPPDGRGLRAELSRIATGLTDAITELQELARGIHPGILSHGGLGSALRTLARRSVIPVELDVATDARFPEPIEVAAYFVASEALANVTKHAQASLIEISLSLRHGSLLLSIRDDGVGGADPAHGSGLLGLADRVEALGGSIHVRSSAGAGTRITADLPLEYESIKGAGRPRGRVPRPGHHARDGHGAAGKPLQP